MNKLALLFLFIAGILSGQNPETAISLEYCQKQALNNYPLIKQKQLLKSSADYKIKNLLVNYYPQIFLNGQASYQSDVTAIPLKIPGLTIPEMYHDTYKVTLDVNQVVYDGGFTSCQKNIEKSTLMIDEQQVEVEIYKLKDRVNQLFFNIMILQENQKLSMIMQAELKSKLAKSEALIKEGVAVSNNADILKAELLKIEQQLIEISLNKKAAIQMLAELMNGGIEENAVFVMPQTVLNSGDSSSNRPELKYFDLQKNKLLQTKQLSSAKLMPKLYVFGQAGYGRPGLNMFTTSFDYYYLVGAKLSWNLWNWNQSHNEKQIVGLQSSILDSQKELFELNTKIAKNKDYAEINKYSALLEKDKEIIALKTKIAANASYMLDNGVITATEYTTELHAELQAKLTLEIHKILLELSKINYLYNLGKI